VRITDVPFATVTSSLGVCGDGEGYFEVTDLREIGLCNFGGAVVGVGTIHSMFDCPEQIHTSPTSTLLRVMVFFLSR